MWSDNSVGFVGEDRLVRYSPITQHASRDGWSDNVWGSPGSIEGSDNSVGSDNPWGLNHSRTNIPTPYKKTYTLFLVSPTSFLSLYIVPYLEHGTFLPPYCRLPSTTGGYPFLNVYVDCFIGRQKDPKIIRDHETQGPLARIIVCKESVSGHELRTFSARMYNEKWTVL